MRTVDAVAIRCVVQWWRRLGYHILSRAAIPIRLTRDPAFARLKVDGVSRTNRPIMEREVQQK
jgi:hypothetical protein